MVTLGVILLDDFIDMISGFKALPLTELQFLDKMQQITQDAGSGHGSACTCALHDKRPRSVPFRVECNDIIRSSQRCRKWMRGGVSCYN